MELERGDLPTLPTFTFLRARDPNVEHGGWRYLLKVLGHGEVNPWMDDHGARWTDQFPATHIELLWHPEGLHSAPDSKELAEVRVLPMVANAHAKQRVAPPRLTPPADFEPENYATDGSGDMELTDLRAQVKALSEQLRAQKSMLTGARTLVENMMDDQEVRRDGHLRKELRELHMILNHGDALRRTARAEEAVEEWLQDPRRSVFGLAADLADILSPTQGAWKK